MFDLADRLKSLKAEKKALNSRLKEVNQEIEATENGLVASMVDEEMQNFNRAGYLFYLRTDTFVRPIPDRKAELYEWLKDNDHGALVYETVNANSLRAFVRELNENGELPVELGQLVVVTERPTVGMRKAR